MRDDAEIVKEFYDRIGGFLNSPRIQRWRNELGEAYQVKAGVQWDAETHERRKNRRRPMVTINKIAPIVRMISGHSIINQDKLIYYPRNRSKAQTVDVMTDAVEYITDDNDFYGVWGEAGEDKLTCGLGFTDTYFSYRNPDAPAGEVIIDRIFPGYCFFDQHATKKNLRDARFMGYFDVVPTEVVEQEKKEYLGDDSSYVAGASATAPMELLLSPFKNHDMIDGYGIIYHYYWIDDINSYSLPREALEPYAVSEQVFTFIQAWLDENQLTLDSGTLYLSEQQMKDLRSAVKMAQEIWPEKFPSLKATKRSIDGYYYARICDGMVLEQRESLSKSGHSMKARTGYYDESRGVWYGIIRDMIPAQRAFNEGISDYLSYLRSVPKGGAYAEESAVVDWDSFKATRANEEDITVVADGSISGGKILPKETPQAVPGLDNYIAVMRQSITEVLGLEADFFAAVDSGNMTAQLFGQKMRQAFKVLAPLLSGDKSALKEQGKFFADCVRVLAENNDGMTLRRVSGAGDNDVFELTSGSLSIEYDVVVDEAPIDDDQMASMIQSLIPLAGQLLNKPNPIDITPLIVENWPYIKERDRQRIQGMMQPTPPPPPDPVNTRLLETQSDEQAARAYKATMEAEKIKKELSGGIADAQALATLEKTQAAAMKDYAAAGHQIKVGAEY